MSIDRLQPNLNAMTDARLADLWRDAMLHDAFDDAWRVSDEVLRRRRAAPPPAELPPRHLQSIWSGEDLTAKHVLVRCYHGLGDTVQFVRFLPALRARAARVTLWLQPALVPLVEHLECLDGECVLPLHDGDPGVPYDVDIELMELPHALRASPYAAHEVPYLRVPSPPRAYDGALHVGLVWRAGDFAPERSLPPDALAPLAELSNIRWHVLQRGAAIDECPSWLTVESTSESTLDTARTMANLDLVITVDSFPAHLAGALGVPVWILLPANADWRWGVAERTVWYPTATLLRQSEIDNWPAVIDVLRTRLRALCRNHRSPAPDR
jgi:hypothetical protein